MNLAKFTTNVLHKHKFNTIQRLGHNIFSPCFSCLKQNFATKNLTKNDEQDAPINYLKSPASKWKAQASRTGYVDTRLWYEPYVIAASLSIFMIYFCILREENEIDKELEKTLYSRITGLEELQLKASLAHNKEIGVSTADIEDRLKEIQQKKSN